MSKKLYKYAETLYHLINFRLSQFKQSRSMLKMDYNTFMIVSCVGAHALKNNINAKDDWESVWEITRTKNLDKFYNKKKLSVKFKNIDKKYVDNIYDLNIIHKCDLINLILRAINKYYIYENVSYDFLLKNISII